MVIGVTKAPFTSEDPLFRRIRQHAEQRSLCKPSATLSDYKSYLRLEDEMVRRYQHKGDSGRRVTLARSIVMDVLLECLFQRALTQYQAEHGAVPTEPGLIALGGYGRQELCPYSDVDIMFLYPARRPTDSFKAYQKYLADKILYMLWDLSLKIGHSTRTARDAMEEARASVESKNAMMEMRFLTGDRNLYDRFKIEYRRFIQRDNAEAYIEERLQDQASRHEKYGNTVYLQEPNIKNGVGGLRDYQNILWIIRLKLGHNEVEKLLENDYLNQQEFREFSEAYDYLLRVRCELHFQSTLATDLLNLEKQPKIAWALGYRRQDIFQRVEAFMRDYYRHARNIARISHYLEHKLAVSSRSRITFREVIRSRQAFLHKEIDGFGIEDGKIGAVKQTVFKEDPERLVRVFRHAQQFSAQLDLDLQGLIRHSLSLLTPRIARRDEVNRSFRSILQTLGNVYPYLYQMHELGVLSRILPEWQELECLVQHEYYHRYTADIHTLNTIKELDAVFLQEGDYTAQYYRAIRQSETPALLYLILLLHDIGKGKSIKDHAEIGAEMSKGILQRMGVKQELTHKILTIIRLHLDMARYSQHYDIDDPRTAATFASVVEDSDTLRLLYVHTYCDARGTANTLWNSYKDTLHTQLYQATLQRFGEMDTQPQETVLSRDTVRALVPELNEDEIEAHYSLLPERYFIYSNAEEVALHIRMVHQLLRTISEADSIGSLVPIVEWRDDLNLSLTVVNVVTWDRAGLFYRLAGAFSVAGLSIISSKAITRADHITIDTFYVCEPGGGIVQNKKAQESFQKHLEAALLHNQDLMPAIEEQSRRLKKPRYMQSDTRLRAHLPARVDVYHELSLQRTIIELYATDTIGLLYRVAKTIYDNGFDITFARIATERDVAVDTFYIEDIDKSKTSDANDLVSLREALNEIIEGDADQAQAT